MHIYKYASCQARQGSHQYSCLNKLSTQITYSRVCTQETTEFKCTDSDAQNKC